MQLTARLRATMALGFALGCAAVPALGQRALAALDRIDAGLWELRARDQSLATDRLCIASARRFIQLRHPDAACERVVVEDGADQVTVQYTCQGHGYGRTTIRRESAQLVQIETQGIAGGLPFAFSVEARRMGSCTG